MLAVIGPGLLVAATGVGAGDLATAGFTGAMLGPAVAWAVVLGAVLKYVLTEGLARWQLATGQTLLEGVGQRIGRWALVLFLLYMIPFSYVVGGALISACGITTNSIFPLVADDPQVGKLVYGSIISLIGLAIAWIGGFAIFERIMAVCIAIMFVAVLVTAVLLEPDWGAVLQGAFVPTIPDATSEEFTWTLSLLGGVGGTVTLLCYGYWIHQQGREGPSWLSTCRLDLVIGYVFTGLFGIAMLLIASGANISATGTNLIVELAAGLVEPLGEWARWVFLIGAWAAVTSSLLGVWQAIPMLFTDALRGACGLPRLDADELVKTTTSRIFLVLLAILPVIQAWQSFKEAQKVYAAFFLPLLAIVLLVLNGRKRLVGKGYRNGPVTIGMLLLTLAIFVIYGWNKLT